MMLLGFVVLFAPFAVAGEAWANCFPSGVRNPLAAGRPSFAAGAAAAAAAAADDDRGPATSPVGLWKMRYLIGTGPDLFDESFQQFHAGGTETMLSNILPPSLGNVCLGIWKQTGARTFKITHRGWNWNPDGTLAGTFLLSGTMRLDRRGDSFSGTWVSDSLDTAGNVIPELHFEGIARAARVEFD
jgi:hypothetical protein